MKLYHYTDAYGLMGIINNRTLWATDINFLNDSREFYAGVESLKKYCQSEMERLSSFRNKKPEDHVIPILYRMIPELINTNLTNRDLYITSFTDKKDNLRQWMSYCPPNAGYCIEFNKDEILIPGVKEQELNIICRTESVDYSQGQFAKDISIESIKKSFNKSTVNVEKTALDIVNNLMFHCCAIKQAEFYDESETRLIIQSRTSREHVTAHRVKSGVIIPYVEYPLKAEWIKKVIIGPNANMQLARRGLEDLLHKNSVSCEIEESKCSLRAF